MKKRVLTSLMLLWSVGVSLCANVAEWQWSADVDAVAPTSSKTHARAFLWIPPKCERVRGIVFGQNNMIEEGILEHRDLRKTLAKLDIAELYVAPTFENWQNATNNDQANARFNLLLRALATNSGYSELEQATVIPIGHSAMASFPWNFAAWNPGRTLAILSIHGDSPLTRLTGNGRPNANWGTRNIDGIPGLMVMGEYEWWTDRLTPAFAFQVKYPQTPLSVLCDAGHGHFDYSDELVRYLALFITKAAEARLADDQGKLKPVDPREGWLYEGWRPNQLPKAKAAPFSKYSGKRINAFWFFDKEMARATENFNPQCDKAPQLVGFVQNGKVIEQTPNTAEQVRISLPQFDDSLSFYIGSAFLGSVPPGNNPAKWTGLTNGARLGHSSESIISLSRISGPVVKVGPEKFAVRLNKSTIFTDRRAGDIWLLASHPGDSKYKSAVQQGLLRLPLPYTEGTKQKIDFPEIGSVKNGTESLKLGAKTDSGSPVYYYVLQGPCELNGDTLVFTKLPPRTRFPVKVTVVAWQWGRNTEPKLRSAEPVERSFFITK